MSLVCSCAVGGGLFDLSLFEWILFFKQKTAYEMRISDWSSDVCSSDLCRGRCHCAGALRLRLGYRSPGDGHRILIKTADRSSSTFNHRRMSPLQTAQHR